MPLEKLQAEGVQVYPSPQTIRQIQNKAVQKQFYAANGIPTAPFTAFESLTDLRAAAEAGTLKLPFVWKSARFGYDGNGVKIVRQLADLNGLPDGQCIAETLVPFAKELAVIVARSSQGEVCTYPVVEMEFHPEANQVEYVILSRSYRRCCCPESKSYSCASSRGFWCGGLLAVELFQTADDEILVNESGSTPSQLWSLQHRGCFILISLNNTCELS